MTGPARKAGSAISSGSTAWTGSRLKGDQGREIWTEWGILTYNLDTLAVRAR